MISSAPSFRDISIALRRAASESGRKSVPTRIGFVFEPVSVSGVVGLASRVDVMGHLLLSHMTGVAESAMVHLNHRRAPPAFGNTARGPPRPTQADCPFGVGRFAGTTTAGTSSALFLSRPS